MEIFILSHYSPIFCEISNFSGKSGRGIVFVFYVRINQSDFPVGHFCLWVAYEGG